MSATYVDCATLPAEWDANEALRDRLRGGKPLVSDDQGKAIKIPRCVENYELLIPILAQIGGGSRLAEIDGLREAVAQVYGKNQRQVSEDIVDGDAWSIRDMVSFIKRKTQRAEVSRVALSRLVVFSWVLGKRVAG